MKNLTCPECGASIEAEIKTISEMIYESLETNSQSIINNYTNQRAKCDYCRTNFTVKQANEQELIILKIRSATTINDSNYIKTLNDKMKELTEKGLLNYKSISIIEEMIKTSNNNKLTALKQIADNLTQKIEAPNGLELIL